MKVRIMPTWADAWVGVYVKRQRFGHLDWASTWDFVTRENVVEWTVYVCLVPFVPFVFRWYRPWRQSPELLAETSEIGSEG